MTGPYDDQRKSAETRPTRLSGMGNNLGQPPIYLDYHAHAPLDPEVAAVLADAFLVYDANPHSHHLAGDTSRKALDEARLEVARFLGCSAAELIFTSGATEANNMAFHGIAPLLRRRERTRILVGAGEHPSVHAAAGRLADFQVEPVALDESGLVNLDALHGQLGVDVGLVSIGWANHEVGTVQPMTEIAALARAAGALLHSDLAQACGHVPVETALLDLASVAAHKFCGPVGIGALMVRRSLRPALDPLLVGGGQEGGARSGTTAVPMCIGFAAACARAAKLQKEESARLAMLRDLLLDRLSQAPGLKVNGTLASRLPGNLNISFDDVDGEALVMRVRDQLAISTGSACSADSLEPSPVLLALGLNRTRAESAIRIGLGRFTTEEEVEKAARFVLDAVTTLRRMSRRVA
ncbi:MAG TPA: cysteine desulfurase family protein [Sphingopyxis sp.]|nr:cysteine desulfurase family protein [Sphingopyxis sp.]